MTLQSIVLPVDVRSDASALERTLSAPEQSRVAAYIGDDWMVLVDADSDYQRSEALAPFLLLAEPGCRLHVVPGQAGEPIVSEAIAHQAGALSMAHDVDCGVVYLYFDPLCSAARAIAAMAEVDNGVAACPFPAAIPWTKDWFDRLVRGGVTSDEVVAWVAIVRACLDSLVEEADASVARRLGIIAAELGNNPSGRVDCVELAEKIHWSPAYLRRVFRKTAGMTLSRYQAWRRMHLTILLTCRHPHAQRSVATSMLHEAGFYDAPHGFKTIRQFFGMDPAEVLQAAHYCR